MAVEAATLVTQLDPTQPLNDDLITEGDEHLRLIKSVLRTTFPNVNGQIKASSDTLNNFGECLFLKPNQIVIKRPLTLGNSLDFQGNKFEGVGDPVDDNDAVPLSFLKSQALDGTYPVGTIVFGYPENPANTFGFGTWERVSPNSAIQSCKEGESALTQKGLDTATMTIATMPSHDHPNDIAVQVDPAGNHAHNYVVNTITTSAHNDGSFAPWTSPADAGQNSEPAGLHNHYVQSSITMGASGNGEPFNIWQASVGLHAWWRKG